MTTRHLITGEYPPQRGGVADYTAQIAQGFAAAGIEVHVWCQGNDEEPEKVDDGITVHRIAGAFDRSGLKRLANKLDVHPAPRSILVQYVPHAYGMRAMNVYFALWLLNRSRLHHDVIDVMFHEVAFPFVRRPLRWNLIAAANRLMLFLILAACRSVYVSIPAWKSMLARWTWRKQKMIWLPVPSNIPSAILPERAIALRSEYVLNSSGQLVGHFGTYHSQTCGILAPILQALLMERQNVSVLLLGRNCERIRDLLLRNQPHWNHRIYVADDLLPQDLSAHIQACDLMLQPYPDGASTRRGTLMACLSNGTATVTNVGPLSEAFWQEEEVCAISPSLAANQFAALAVDLLMDTKLRNLFADFGRAKYLRCFSLQNTLTVLLSANAECIQGEFKTEYSS